MGEPADEGVVRDEPARVLPADHRVRTGLGHACGRVSALHLEKNSFGVPHHTGVSVPETHGLERNVSRSPLAPIKSPLKTTLLTSVYGPDQRINMLQRVGTVRRGDWVPRQDFEGLPWRASGKVEKEVSDQAQQDQDAERPPQARAY